MMKTTKTWMCAALVAVGLGSLVAPLSAAVESDIVGYQTIAMEAGKWYQIGTPFVALDGADSQKLNDAFNTGFANGDVIYLYNPETMLYKDAYYWSDKLGGWGNYRGSALADISLPNGQAVFIHKSVEGDVQLRGKVDTSIVVDFGSETGNAWNQIVCVYPEAKKLNDMVWSGLSSGDIIYVYDSETMLYKDAYYWSDKLGGWGNYRGSALTDIEIPAGQALFIYKKSANLGSVSVK